MALSAEETRGSRKSLKSNLSRLGMNNRRSRILLFISSRFDINFSPDARVLNRSSFYVPNPDASNLAQKKEAAEANLFLSLLRPSVLNLE
jgi:hypothetical protein